MWPGGVSGGGAGAQWKQNGSIARGNMPWSALERRLPCQMNCTRRSDRALMAAGGTLVVFRQIIARGNVAWRCVWRGCRRSMETKRFHRARQYALECARAAIAMSDELHEQTRKIQARTIIARTIPVRTKRYSMLKHLTFARDPNYFLYYIASERRLLSSGDLPLRSIPPTALRLWFTLLVERMRSKAVCCYL